MFDKRIVSYSLTASSPSAIRTSASSTVSLMMSWWTTGMNQKVSAKKYACQTCKTRTLIIYIHLRHIFFVPSTFTLHLSTSTFLSLRLQMRLCTLHLCRIAIVQYAIGLFSSSRAVNPLNGAKAELPKPKSSLPNGEDISVTVCTSSVKTRGQAADPIYAPGRVLRGTT